MQSIEAVEKYLTKNYRKIRVVIFKHDNGFDWAAVGSPLTSFVCGTDPNGIYKDTFHNIELLKVFDC